MALYYNDEPLVHVEFNNEEKAFMVSDESKNYVLSIPYIPTLETEKHNPNDFYLFLFENNHLNAENDIFQLYDKDENKRIGWVFPISVLDSNENDYADNKHLNKYKFVAYQKLLSKSFTEKIQIKKINEDVSISKIFGDDIIIVILSKTQISKDNFNIYSFYPSLATYGYFLKNENKLNVTYPINYLIDKFRGQRRLYLKYVDNSILSIDFIIKLYENYLKELDHHLIRFHLLYQVIEYLITNIFSENFEDLLEKYNKKQITKNNFIEEINNIRNERKNIHNIFKQLHFTNQSFEKDVKIDFERDLKDFLREFDIKEKENLGDLIYDTRNIIVHNYREIKDETLKILDMITYEFEIIVNYLIINHP